MSADAADDQATRTVVCLVEVSGRTLAIEIAQAREARRVGDCTVVPLGPPHLMGLMNVRGAIVPLVDVRVLLGLPAGDRTDQSLVVEANAVRIALAVDRVHGVESIDGPDEPWTDPLDAAWFQPRCSRRGDDITPVLDVVKIVGSLA